MVTLKSANTTVSINPLGAWVEELNVNGSPIFYPKVSLRSESGEEKVRGGMHVCLPNFGPGGDSDLPQHGFGRTEEWQITEQGEAQVTLELTGGSLHYALLYSTLRYELSDSSFSATLSLANRGAKPLRIAPAFHPYFALQDSETAVVVNGTTYELSSLSGTIFITAESVELVTANASYHFSQSGLNTWAIWTDQLGSYVCVEPTFGGNRFLEPQQPDEQLAPNETRQYSFTISW